MSDMRYFELTSFVGQQAVEEPISGPDFDERGQSTIAFEQDASWEGWAAIVVETHGR